MAGGRGHRYAPRDPNEGVPSNSFEDADWLYGWNNYAAATRDMDPAERPAYDMTEWVDDQTQPTTPPWVPEPASTYDREAASGWGRLPGHRSDHCMSMDPGCQGECGG